jgi:hypothetical protein
VAGLLTHAENGDVNQNLLIDAGLGTLTGLADWQADSFWDQPLAVFITHGHIDHHAELMILSEIYCNRRGDSIEDKRPPLTVYCTEKTYEHLYQTHRYGFTTGNTLQPIFITSCNPVELDIFEITPLAVEDHFEGAVIFIIEFGPGKKHKIIIGWDLKTPPLAYLDRLRAPSLALFEATTWTRIGYSHMSIEELAQSGFLDQLQLQNHPAQQKYGAYLVHYSGREDPWGMLTDEQLGEKFRLTFPDLSPVVQIARRGQVWKFSI